MPIHSRASVYTYIVIQLAIVYRDKQFLCHIMKTSVSHIYTSYSYTLPTADK